MSKRKEKKKSSWSGQSLEELGAFHYKSKEHVEWYTATNGLGRVALVFDGKAVTIYRIMYRQD